MRRAVDVLAVLCALALPGCGAYADEPSAAGAAALTGGGSAEEGRGKIRAYGCGACHTVAGVPGANGKVGPPLTGMVERMYVAGRLPHTPENLVRWIQDPTAIDPATAMPDVGVTEGDARDIAAYLYTTR